MKRLIWLLVGLVWCVCGAAAQTPQARVGQTKPSNGAKNAQPKFKAIWEPINYPDDVSLMSVFFVNDQLGWISGKKYGSSEGGFILQTKDGGDHWAVQLGDPQSSDPAINNLRFIDATHGWAVQKDKLVRTSDGSNWEDAGSLPQFVPFLNYAFTSPDRGTFLGGYPTEGSKIFTTHDGGKTWKQVFQCATKLEVNGLTRNTGCSLNPLHFPTPAIGYAAGGGDEFFVVAKTQDGGETWSIASTIGGVPVADTLFFTSATTGVARTLDDKFYMTTDGGTSWKGMTGAGNQERIGFAFNDPESGWSFGRRTLGFTTDGGKHWNSRDFKFPVDVQAFSFPSRQRGYVVGDHGMIYRYRIVPIDYTSKGMLDAPMMPAASAEGSGK
jgi:photosystem II stability/assembly factor-like uncharacterized protein